jgi:hypothetical protein
VITSKNTVQPEGTQMTCRCGLNSQFVSDYWKFSCLLIREKNNFCWWANETSQQPVYTLRQSHAWRTTILASRIKLVGKNCIFSAPFENEGWSVYTWRCWIQTCQPKCSITHRFIGKKVLKSTNTFLKQKDQYIFKIALQNSKCVNVIYLQHTQ